MKKKGIKEKFHKLIDEFEDEKYLSYVFEAMVAYNDKKSGGVDIVDELTEDQKKDLEEAIQQDDAGETMPHEEVKKKINKWLTE